MSGDHGPAVSTLKGGLRQFTTHPAPPRRPLDDAAWMAENNITRALLAELGVRAWSTLLAETPESARTRLLLAPVCETGAHP